MAETNKTPLLYTSFLYVCSLILFLEWLYPITILADINQIDVFIIYTVFCFLLSLLQLRWWATLPLKLAGLVIIVHWLYIDVPFMQQAWFQWVSSELTTNFQAIYTQSWYDLTNFFRTILFLLIIWIMSYLTHYWFYVMKRFFLFVLLTFIYIAVVDTFTVYDAKMAIIRVFVVSFIALGVAHLLKEMTRESLGFRWMKRAPLWIVPIMLMVLLSAIIGFAAPKYEPQWPDPVPFVKGIVNPDEDGNDTDQVRKVGYGEDDSKLGGSFIQDDSVVFRALSPTDHYWRVETKDVYTGKGWEQLEETKYVEQKDGHISFSTYSEDVTTEEHHAMVTFEFDETIDRLVYPYMPTTIEEAGETQFLLDTATEGIHTKLDGEKTELTSYRMTYAYPLYDLDALQNADIHKADTEFYKHYTQLPDELPDRVIELAEEITEPHANMHDKALAIENYFQENDYVYETEDVAIPEQDEDYVDQFLFDTQAGYCDNYSTSMVVMLRSVGIPTRWAKGFTSGEQIDIDAQQVDGESADLYEITNSNAHSWVEVYFDDIGWVPFEPTKGFSNGLVYEADEDSDNETNDENDEEETDEENENNDDPDNSQTENEGGSSDSDGNDGSTGWFNTTYVLISICVFLLIIGYVLYKTRDRWRTTLMSKRLSKKEDIQSFEAAYQHLLRVLHNQGFVKQPDQTLREYAKEVDAQFMTTEMRVLTQHYEQALYAGSSTQKIDHNLLDIWHDLMKRVLA